MANDFVNALDEEITSLEASLKNSPVYQKLQELKRIRGLYAGGSTLGASTSGSPQISQANFGVASARRGGNFAERQRILLDAAQYIRGRSQPTPTSEIFEHLNILHEITGKQPKNNLSAMLSNSEMFEAHGRSGWTLVEEQESEAPESSRKSNDSEASTAAKGRLDDPGGGG